MATLFPGQSLLPGQTLQSDYGVYTLTMQPDGNVVLRDNASTPLLRTGTGGGQFDPRDFIMQTDGNLVLYDTSGQPHWASKTQGNPGAFLNVQADGNLVVYRAGSTSQTANNSLWSSGTNVPPPLHLAAVVDSGAMLNVGDANLPNLSHNMLYSPDGAPNGNQNGIDMLSYTEQGSWSQVGPAACGEFPITVNATITASWAPGGGPGWAWQQVRDAFADALGTAMTAASNPTAYQNYSYTEFPTGDTVVCLDPQPSTLGHYIPPGFQITAWNKGVLAGQVTVRYSTGDQSGESVCGAIKDIVSSGLPLILEDAPAAIVATLMAVTCALFSG